MALKDCIKKLGVVSDSDVALLEQWIDQGLTDDEVLQRYELHINKTLFDITKRAQAKGAPVSVKRDVLAEVRSFGEAQLNKARGRLAEVRNEHTALNADYSEVTWVEGNVKHWEDGGPDINLSDNGALLVRFHQMLFRPKMRKDLRDGSYGAQQFRGKDAYELLDSFREMQARGDQIRRDMHELFMEEVELINQIDSLTDGGGFTIDPETGEYRMGPLPPSRPPGISEESWSYTFSTEAPKPPFTVKTGKGAEGDLYIQRVGPNAGTVHRTRQGPSDMAISFNKDLLDTNYMFYLLQAIQPKLLARAHGTAQQAINKRDLEEVIGNTFRNMVQDRGPQDPSVFTDRSLPAETRQVESEAAYNAVVRNVTEKEISVGITNVSEAADAAHVVAAIRKDAQETMWAVILDENDNVLSIVEHTKGAIAAAAIFPSVLAGAIHATAGAKKVWFAHNHPSGDITPSGADKFITEKMTDILHGSGIEVSGHVILGAGAARFTHLGPDGVEVSRGDIKPAARRKKVKITKRVIGKQLTGVKVNTPDQAIELVNSMGNPEGIVMFNVKLEVIGFLAMTPSEMEQLRDTGASARILKAFGETNTEAWLVSTKEKQTTAVNNMAALGEVLNDTRMIDALYLDRHGRTRSMGQQGLIVAASTFYQTVPGLHSGLMVAAQTMPQSKGTVQDMMNLLKKQPGVSKVQKPLVDEEGKPILEAGLPSKKLKIKIGTKTVDVRQNPTEEELHAFRVMVRMEYKAKGWSITADPITRSTWDPEGNEFVWDASEAIHDTMENALAPTLGLETNNQEEGLSQHNEGRTGKRKQIIETTYPEMDFLQLEEFFVARGGAVTQGEIIAYIRQNGIKIEETIYGGDIIKEPQLTTQVVDVESVYDQYDLPYGDPDGSIIFNTLDGESQRDYDIIYDPQLGTAAATPDGGKTWLAIHEPTAGDLRIANQDQQEAALNVANQAIKVDIRDRERGIYAGPSQWAGTEQVLPGGKFDREILLRTPKVGHGGVVFSGNLVASGGRPFTDDQVDEMISDVADNEYIGDVVVSRITNDAGEIIGVTFENLAPEDYQDFADLMSATNTQMTDEDSNIEEIRKQLDEGELDPIQQRQVENYEGGHWAEPNVFVHIRVSDRIGPNGEKILFIEEMQSSPHQRGSRVGYREYILPPPTDFEVVDKDFAWVAYVNGKPLQYGDPGTIAAGGETVAINKLDAATPELARAALKALMKETHDAQKQAQTDKVPQLPFKGNAWVSLAMKRIIRMASEEGYDQIGFITGEQQVLRNKQGESISEISWDPIREELQMWDVDGNLTVNVHAAEENLIEHMGEERVNELKSIVQERNKLYDIHKGIEVDLDYDPVGLAFAEDLDITRWTAEDLAELAEKGELFTAIDQNGEFIRGFGGDIIISQTREGMQDAVNEELFPEDSIDLPKLTGLDDFTMNESGRGNMKFYNSTLPNLARKAARKMDRKADVLLHSTQIHTKDGAPFTIEIRKSVRVNQVALLEWVLMDDTGRQLEGPFENEERAQSRMDDLNNISATIHTMDITEQLAKASMEGTTFYQKKRGAISFDMARKGVIKLTETRDLSTFMHEAGHLYLEIMGGLAEDPNVPQQIKDDYAKILEFLGVSSREEIGRKEHEKWAESFEKYLQEGRAPSVALQSAFNAYRRWLTDIWKRMKGDSPDGIILTEEIRDVMDRILASDDQIAVANAQQEFAAVFSTAEQMGVTQREFDVYKGAILKATNEAVEKETVRLMAAQGREQKAWWRDELAKVTAIVEAEAWEQQIYKAFALLAHGKQPNGEALEQGTPFKIDKASLLELLAGSQRTLKALPKPWVYTVKGGVDVDIAAKQLGYRDGMALVTALMEMPKMKDWIEVTAKERMDAAFQDPLLDGSVSENAVKAVHNEARANVLVAEMRELRKLMKEDRAIVGATKRDIREQATLARLANRGLLPKRDELKIIKAFARDTMGALRIMDVRPEVYLNAERKAGRLAFEAAARGDYEKAYNFKRQQTVNHELYRAAVRAKDQTTGWRNYLAKFSKPRVIQRLGKLGVIEPILAVIEGIQLKKITLKAIDRKTALQMLAQQIHDGEVITPIAEHLYHIELDKDGNELVILNESPFKNWQEMTVDELHAMRDIVKQLEHQAKRKLEMPVNGEMVVMDDAINELTEQVLEVNEQVDIGVGTKGTGQRIKQGWTSGIAHWLGPSVMGRILDKQGWGAHTRLIIVTMRRAIAEKLIPMQRKALADVSKIYLKFYAKGTLNWRTKELRQLDKKNFAVINGESLSKGDVISIAMNMGNEGNKSAMFNGIRIDDKVAYPEDQVMAALALLDANDWAFVQAIWDYFDTYWPALSAMEKERRGISPERVEHVPFTVQTADGQTINMRGGYFPLSYNYEHSERHEERVFADHYKSMRNSSFLAANTRAGATHNRVKNHNMVVQLGLFQIEKHLKEITRDIAIGDEVNFANNLLNNKGYRKAMKQTGNATSLRELELWLTDAAVGELPANNVIERRMAWLRVGFTVSKLAFNVYTTLLQFTGIFQSMATLGSGAMAMGAGRVMRNPWTAWTEARDASAFLRARYNWQSQAFDKDVHDAAGVLSEYGPGLPTTRRRIRSTAARMFFLPIAKMQQIVDVITWWGAVWKARNNLDLSEQEAVYYADAQVELAQTSGFFSDRSGIERGTLSATTRQQQFIRLWTTLISYMQRKGGIAYMKTQELKQEMSILKATQYAIDMMLLFTVEGIASAILYGRWDWEEDDPEKILLAAGKETLLSIAAGIPFVREFQSAIYGSGNTPLGALTKDLVTLYVQGMQGELDPALRKAFVNSAGTLLHLPASQTNRLLEALIDEDDPELLEYFTGTRD